MDAPAALAALAATASPVPASLPLPPSLSIASTGSSDDGGATVATTTTTDALFRLPLRVGCVGGGQLGRMMALEAPRLNIVMSFLDVDGPTCPAAQVVPSNRIYQGTLHDAAKIRQLVQEQRLDVLTVEIEHVGVETLLELEEQEGVNVQPSARVLQIIRDKFVQKQHLVQHGIPTAPFYETSSVAAIQQAAKTLGLPLMLKSRRGGYDGRGNAVLKADTEQAILDALWTLDSGNSATDQLDLYAEGWIDHVCEISVLVVQSTVANIPPLSYPPVTTIQQDSVCRVVLAPAPNLSDAISKECQRIAQRAIEALGASTTSTSTTTTTTTTSLAPAAGIYGVELFVTRDHQVLVNEIAPRPHNTGHFTQDACHVNQFENHLRAVSGLPLGSTDMKVEAAAMINIMGAASNRLEDTVVGANLALTMPRATVHWYGKEKCRKGRKMGHINLTANSQGELFSDLLPLLDLEGIPRELVLSPTQALLSTTMPLYMKAPSSPPPLVAVIMGSQSDLPTMRGAVDILKQFYIPHQVDIVSAHRTPDKLVEYAKTAESRGIRVIIAGAGGAAHLPGMVASLTPLPVIGVPVMTSTLHGVDSLYSIVQMPKGIPVATVAIGNAPNAGLLAVRMLSTSRVELRRKLQQYQQDLEKMVDESSSQLQQLGTDAFLKQHKLA